VQPRLRAQWRHPEADQAAIGRRGWATAPVGTLRHKETALGIGSGRGLSAVAQVEGALGAQDKGPPPQLNSADEGGQRYGQ